MTLLAAPFDYEAAIAECAQGDRSALQRIYECEGARMLATALRIVRVRAQAEDVVHDAVVGIWKGAGGFNAARGSGRGWIYSIVRHRALNALRDRAPEQVEDEEALEAHAAVEALAAYRSQPDAYERNSTLGRLGHCLDALEPVRRNCILHAYVDGCSHAEVAERIGAPLGTVKAWIRRSLANLRECMQ